jgi:hypothetical protein
MQAVVDGCALWWKLGPFWSDNGMLSLAETKATAASLYLVVPFEKKVPCHVLGVEWAGSTRVRARTFLVGWLQAVDLPLESRRWSRILGIARCTADGAGFWEARGGGPHIPQRAQFFGLLLGVLPSEMVFLKLSLAASLRNHLLLSILMNTFTVLKAY